MTDSVSSLRADIAHIHIEYLLFVAESVNQAPKCPEPSGRNRGIRKVSIVQYSDGGACPGPGKHGQGRGRVEGKLWEGITEGNTGFERLRREKGSQ